MLKDTKPSTSLIVLKFDPRKGIATVITGDGKRVQLGWEHVKLVARLLAVGSLVTKSDSLSRGQRVNPRQVLRRLFAAHQLSQ
jgi:hypothetical protein